MSRFYQYRLTFKKDTSAPLYNDDTCVHDIPFAFKSGAVVEVYSETPHSIFKELNQVFFFDDEFEYKISKKNIDNFTFEMIGQS